MHIYSYKINVLEVGTSRVWDGYNVGIGWESAESKVNMGRPTFNTHVCRSGYEYFYPPWMVSRAGGEYENFRRVCYKDLCTCILVNWALSIDRGIIPRLEACIELVASCCSFRCIQLNNCTIYTSKIRIRLNRRYLSVYIEQERV